MSKPQTGPSSTAQADRKEKASPLGDDMDKEFGSWKSMSAIEDDAVDFNLEAFPKGLKNAFNNDNLDMDFNIGGDFGKISSFNVDMEDFDFSSPVKKNAKPKDKPQEESSSGKIKAKPSSCSFSFDFNELDDFGFGSSLTEGEKKSNSLERQSTIADGQEDWIDDDKLTESPQLEPLTKSKEENTKNTQPEKKINFQTQSNLLEQQREKSNANPAQIESNPLTKSKEENMKNTQPEKKINFQTQSNLLEQQREKSNAYPAIESNMVGDSSSPAGGSTTEKPPVSGNVKKHANNTDISFHVNPSSSTEQATKSSTQESVNPKVIAPSMPSIPKTLSVGRNPFPSLKASSKAPDLSSLKISGLMGAKSGLSNSSFRNEPKSVMNSKVHPKVDESLSSEMTHSTDTEKQTPMTPPVKRKTCEAPNTDFTTLNPPKRFSESPRDEISSHVNPSSSTEQASKSSIQESVNPKVIAPSMASIQKTLSVERNLFPSLKAASKMPDLSRLKISGLTGAKSGLSDSSIQKELKSMTNLKVHPKVDERSSSELGDSTDTEKRTPVTPSLTRKTCEAPHTDFATLNPPKRFSPYPRDETRVKEVSKNVQQQDSKLENRVNSYFKNPVCDPLASTYDFPRELDMVEIENPLAMETDANIEKAESYAKELENICNSLKKKHEEAKELLVRAVINNNNLLMLNHPIYDEKIRNAQKLAERLMQMEIAT